MGIKVANYPLTSEQLNSYELPQEIIRNKKKTIALTTSAQMLHKIREKRYKGSHYAKKSTCTDELQQAKQMYMQYNLPVINTEGKSIEEISVQTMQLIGIKKKIQRSR
jgi:regulator of PEP synthase PpsR (kinase-PPPase family)